VALKASLVGTNSTASDKVIQRRLRITLSDWDIVSRGLLKKNVILSQFIGEAAGASETAI